MVFLGLLERRRTGVGGSEITLASPEAEGWREVEEEEEAFGDERGRGEARRRRTGAHDRLCACSGSVGSVG